MNDALGMHNGSGGAPIVSGRSTEIIEDGEILVIGAQLSENHGSQNWNTVSEYTNRYTAMMHLHDVLNVAIVEAHGSDIG